MNGLTRTLLEAHYNVTTVDSTLAHTVNSLSNTTVVIKCFNPGLEIVQSVMVCSVEIQTSRARLNLLDQPSPPLKTNLVGDDTLKVYFNPQLGPMSFRAPCS